MRRNIIPNQHHVPCQRQASYTERSRIAEDLDGHKAFLAADHDLTHENAGPLMRFAAGAAAVALGVSLNLLGTPAEHPAAHQVAASQENGNL